MENSRYQSVLKLGPLTAELAESTYICKVTSGNSPPKRTTFELPGRFFPFSFEIVIADKFNCSEVQDKK